MNTKPVTRSVPGSHFPTFRRLAAGARRFPRAFCGFLLRLSVRSWRLFRRVFLSRRSFAVYAAGGTAICLFYAACSWYYRRAWAQEKERIAASGSSLDISQLIPPPPRDEDNFFATPVLREFFEAPEDAPTRLTVWSPLKRTITVIRKDGTSYKKTLPPPPGNSLAVRCDWLRQLGTLPSPPAASPGAQELLADHRYDDIFEELNAAANRPESRVPRIYANPATMTGPVYKVSTLSKLVTSLILRGRAMIAEGHLSGAVDMLRILSRISDGYAHQGTLMPVLISSSFRQMDDILLEGMHEHHWTDEVLAELLKADPRPLYHKAWAKAAETERAFGCGQYENYATTFLGQENPQGGLPIQPAILRMYPDGLWMRDCLLNSRFHEAWGKETGPLASGESWASRLERIKTSPPPLLLNFMVLSSDGEAFNYLLQLVAPRFVQVEITRTAIRLERHWLKHRRYPATLAELDPAPPEGIPLAMDGKPLRYRTNIGGSTFRVWSPRSPSPPNPDPGVMEKDDLLFANE